MLATRLIGSKGISLPTLTWIGATSQVASASSFTFSGVDIGTPSATRQIIVGVSAFSPAVTTLSSVTVAGNAATAHIGTATSAQFSGGITSIADSTNSTANIVVTMSGTCNECAIFVWVATGLNSGTPIAALTDGGTFSLALSVQQNGPYVALVRGLTSTDIAWTGATEDVDTVGSSGLYASAASSIASSTISQTITASGFTVGRGFVASWR